MSFEVLSAVLLKMQVFYGMRCYVIGSVVYNILKSVDAFVLRVISPRRLNSLTCLEL